MKAVIKH